MKLTTQQIDKLLEHVLQLQEQPSLDNINTIRANQKQQQQNKQLRKDILAKRGHKPIPGLKGPYEEPINGTQAEWIATVIYSSKGTTWDDEHNPTVAILSIKDKTEFEATQRALQKLTGGKGIGQYVAGYFGTYDKNYIAALLAHNPTTELNKYIAPISKPVTELMHFRNHWKTARRLKKIITHLKKIGAYSSTISELQKAYDKVKYIASLENKIWKNSSVKWAVDHRHEILLVLEILAACTGWGYLLSMGIGLANAALYAVEGEYYQAGIQAIFAIMPGVFKLAGKLPELAELMAKLGERKLIQLAGKLASKNAKFTKLEQKIITGLAASKKFIKGIFEEAANIGAKRAALKSLMKMKSAETAAAGFGRLTAKDKIIIGLANGTFNVAEFSIMWGKFGIVTDMAVDQIWNKIYERYIMNTELEQKNNKRIADEYKKLTGKDISTLK